MVSHDRSLLEATTDRFLLIDQGRLRAFDGDLNDYRQYRLNALNPQTENDSPAPSAPSRKDQKRQEAHLRQERARLTKPLLQKMERAENELARGQEEQKSLEAFLGMEDAYAPHNKEKLQQTLTRLTELKLKLTELEENWLQWQEAVDDIERQLQQSREQSDF